MSQRNSKTFSGMGRRLCISSLTVGTPVTQRPPHRPGRAVFPHPVSRMYSLSRKAFALGKHSIPLGRCQEFEFCDPEAIYTYRRSFLTPFPTGTFTLQDAPRFARRDEVQLVSMNDSICYLRGRVGQSMVPLSDNP